MAFQLVVPQGSSFDYMGIVPPFTYQGVPQDSTSFMWWLRQNNPYNYVSLTMENGSLFGLNAVDLADPTAPSLSPVSISFIGFLSGGGTVTNTFTTPGGGATTFATYTFNSAFASGLTSVDILAPRWAMDNLAFTVIPEPGTLALLGLGALGWLLQFKRGRANRPE
ncbi:MAG TPA: PEP-CTERM sorting domain-containing protein [Clostridia bacterium]|nr:PEP-CTERM sorting domain-containing protein [Clostridia bacterium]